MLRAHSTMLFSAALDKHRSLRKLLHRTVHPSNEKSASAGVKPVCCRNKQRKSSLPNGWAAASESVRCGGHCIGRGKRFQVQWDGQTAPAGPNWGCSRKRLIRAGASTGRSTRPGRALRKGRIASGGAMHEADNNNNKSSPANFSLVRSAAFCLQRTPLRPPTRPTDRPTNWTWLVLAPAGQ